MTRQSLRVTDHKLTVARGYDGIAEGYLRWRTTLGREARDLGST
jgi:hypothetical protein